MKQIPTTHPGAVIALLATFFVIAPIAAQESVYGPAAPPGAGFVRVFNAGSGEIATDIGTVRFGPTPPGAVTPYRPVSEGLYIVQLAGRSGEVFVRSGRYATVVVGDDAVVAIDDAYHDDPAKAQIVLYNALFGSVAGYGDGAAAYGDGAAASLVVVPGGDVAIAGVAPRDGSAVAVNAVDVSFAVVPDGAIDRAAESDAALTVPEFTLRRGESFSIFLYGGVAGPAVTVDRARVEVE